MTKERALLRNMKAGYKVELTSLKHYIRELARRSKEHSTDEEHSGPALMKARNDADFYKNRIKDITARLKELTSRSADKTSNSVR